MASPRKDEFLLKDLELAEWCRALGHPARVAILKNLAARKECICGDLVIDLPLAQSTVSQHLKALKKAGLIRGEIDGARSKYCIDRKNFERFVRAFSNFKKILGGSL